MSGLIGTLMSGGTSLVADKMQQKAEDKFKKSPIGKIADEGIGGFLEERWNKSGIGSAVNDVKDYFSSPPSPTPQTMGDYKAAGGIMAGPTVPPPADFSNVKLQYSDPNSMQLQSAGSPLPNLTQQGSIDALLASPTWQQIIAKTQQ